MLIDSLFNLFVAPFTDFLFMRRALLACIALGLMSGPIGVLLVMRRMSLAGDAISHAVLPGVAIAYMIAGMSLPALGLGAFISATVVALLSGAVAQYTSQKEDASLAAFYIMALALGVAMISMQANSVNLIHLLFGNVLAVDNSGLLLVVSVTSLSLLTLAVIWRPLLMAGFDPSFLVQYGHLGRASSLVFMLLVVLAFVASFQTLGTLMAVGLLMLPATAARFWTKDIVGLCLIAALIAAISAVTGLLISFHVHVPSGPAIVLVAGALYVLSLLIGARESVWVTLRRSSRHKLS